MNNKVEAAGKADFIKIKNKLKWWQKLLRLLTVLSVTAIVVTFVYFVLEDFGILEKINTVEKLREIILSAGIWSYVVFFVFQFLQVTFIPIPSALSTLVGVLIFGPWVAFIYSTVAILSGSIFAFYLGKNFGTRIIRWVAGEHDANKFRERMSRCKYVFCLLLMIPFTPDDIICLVAGTTDINYRFFLTCTLIIRPINIFCLCFFGSGSIIPFNSFGLPIWIIFIAVMAILFVLVIKYQQAIENKLNKLTAKITLKRNNKKANKKTS